MSNESPVLSNESPALSNAAHPVLAIALGIVPASFRRGLFELLPPQLPPDWEVRDIGDTTDAVMAAVQAAGPTLDWTTLLVTPALGGSFPLDATLAGCLAAFPSLRLALYAHPDPATTTLVRALAGHGLTNILLDQPPPTPEDFVRLVTTDAPRSSLTPFLTEGPAMPVVAPDLLAGASSPSPPETPLPSPAWSVLTRWRSWRPQRRQADEEPAESAAPRPAPTPLANIMAVRQMIAVLGLGGGRFTSRTAVFTAKALADAYGSVLLLDWDPRGGLVPWLGHPPPDACWEATVRADPDTRLTWDWHAVRWALTDQWHVLTAQGRWPERPLTFLTPSLIQDIVAWALPAFDFLVVDCGSDWTDPRTVATLALSQAVLLCAAPGTMDVHRAQQFETWATLNQWPIATRHAVVGSGSDRDWRHQGGRPWLTAWQDTDPGSSPAAVADACAHWIVTRAVEPRRLVRGG